MRKPLIALGLAVTAGLGASPVADALAASPNSQKSPPATPGTYTSQAVATNANSVSGAQIVQTALRYLGYPYTATGNSPATGFSCIGFVSYVYRTLGIPLPGDLGNAIAYAPAVPFSNLQPGDILYFQNTIWRGISHTGIYIGGGRFIHAEWYNRGVVVSSFNADKTDGNYWVGKYLGANRPWKGVAVGAVVNTSPAGSLGPTKPGATPQTSIGTGNATVTVVSLNIRSAPSKTASVRQVVPQGTNLTILQKQNGWYRVQLPDGSTGWVVAAGIAVPAPSAAVQQVTNPSAQVANPTVGTTVAPPRTGQVTVGRPKGTTVVKVTGLRVHTSPSVDAPVVTTVGQGQQMQVIGRSPGWLKIQTATGTVGWVKASMTSGSKTSAASPPATPGNFQEPANSRAASGTAHVTSSVRLHAGPSVGSRVITTAAPGTRITVLGHKYGWALVRLPGGQTGYVYGVYIHR